MNIVNIKSRIDVLETQPQVVGCGAAKDAQRHQVKIDVKRVLMSQNKLTSTIVV